MSDSPFWDRWFNVSHLDEDLRRKLSAYDLIRLGQRALWCMVEVGEITQDDMDWAHAEIERIEKDAIK